ncbi:unnamed protein product [Rodentolepis nana]|uniref:Acetyl-CoA C-acetyltransferase n=1 Tax=Rodentolepis nana TaxID=102285 RepID=A0A0R3THX2_RODNA|nr:unnamed protein product [Rodentolepis nana]
MRKKAMEVDVITVKETVGRCLSKEQIVRLVGIDAGAHQPANQMALFSPPNHPPMGEA